MHEASWKESVNPGRTTLPGIIFKMDAINDLPRRIAKQKNEWISLVCSLLEIPSISTLPEHTEDVKRAAAWLFDRLRDIGFLVEIHDTPRHPIVFAQRTAVEENAKTLLVYGHYDVQPVDPLNEWRSFPFIPRIEGDFIYARGAMDMKGQLAAFLCAVRILLAEGPLPVNLKCVFEGEEEIGSPHLAAFLAENREKLACDAVLNLDGLITRPDTPSIVYGLRGLAFFDVELTGLEHDLHSGLFGGTILNPIQVLCDLLSGMHDRNGKITLPGFYRSVVPIGEAERGELAKASSTDQEYRKETGAFVLWGEDGYSVMERRCARPTLDINGMMGGFCGEGAKTIIPARAQAKISFRIVPNQTPDEIRQLLRTYFAENVPAGIKWSITMRSKGLPVMIDRENWAMRLAVHSIGTAFGKDPITIREGGTIPAVAMIKEILGYESILLGCGVAGDGMHAPNERLRLSLMEKTIQIYAQFIGEVSRLAERESNQSR